MLYGESSFINCFRIPLNLLFDVLFQEFCIAAIDNPANNMEWTLAEMLKNPEILKKALKELDEVVGRDRLVQESDIPNLNYLKACCRETFRIHPSAHYVPTHVARQDTTLGGYFIPKGKKLYDILGITFLQ